MPKSKKKDGETSEVISPQQQRPLVPGYERICEICPFKDNYIASKQVGGLLQQIESLKTSVKELEEKRDKLKDESA